MKHCCHTKKFPTQKEAVEYIDNGGWAFIGKKGLFKTYYMYKGVTITTRSPSNKEIIDHYLLKLYPDGYVKLYHDWGKSPSGIAYQGKIPSLVYRSYDHYLNTQGLIGMINEEISEADMEIYVTDNWHFVISHYPSGTVESETSFPSMSDAVNHLNKTLSKKIEISEFNQGIFWLQRKHQK